MYPRYNLKNLLSHTNLRKTILCTSQVSTLRSLASGGRAVVTTIHAPSSRREPYDSVYMYTCNRCVCCVHLWVDIDVVMDFCFLLFSEAGTFVGDFPYVYIILRQPCTANATALDIPTHPGCTRCWISCCCCRRGTPSSTGRRRYGFFDNFVFDFDWIYKNFISTLI